MPKKKSAGRKPVIKIGPKWGVVLENYKYVSDGKGAIAWTSVRSSADKAAKKVKGRVVDVDAWLKCPIFLTATTVGDQTRFGGTIVGVTMDGLGYRNVRITHLTLSGGRKKGGADAIKKAVITVEYKNGRDGV